MDIIKKLGRKTLRFITGNMKIRCGPGPYAILTSHRQNLSALEQCYSYVSYLVFLRVVVAMLSLLITVES
jgi:hypothetical protein